MGSVERKKQYMNTRQIVALCLMVLALSSTGWMWLIVQANPVSPNVYLNDLPSQATYTVKTDGVNYWAVRYDGYIAYESTNATTVIQGILNLKTNVSIFFQEGTYVLSGGLNFDHNDTQYVVLQGQTRMGVTLLLNAPDRILSYCGRTGLTLAAAYWPRFYFRDITIKVQGDYSATTNTPVKMTYASVHLSNVHLLDYATIKTPANVFEFGGAGAPGAAVTWNFVYLQDSTVNLIGTSGTSAVLYVRYEGFHWVGGGVGIGTNIATSANRLNVMSMGSGAGQAVVLEDLPLFISPGVALARRAYIEAGFLEVRNVEFPNPNILVASTGSMIKSLSATYAYVMIRRANGNEGNNYNYTSWNLAGPGVTAGTSLFIYYEGVLRNQSKSIAVGTSSVYGATSYFDLYGATSFRLLITAASISGETVSVRLNITHFDGVEKSLVKTFASDQAYELSVTDLVSLAWLNQQYLLEIQANTSDASAGPTVSIDVISG